MISRNLLFYLLLCILPFVYYGHFRLRKNGSSTKHILNIAACLAMVAYTFYLAQEPNFIPNNDRIYILYIYLFLVGFFIIPFWVYLICSLIGKGCSKLIRKYRHTSKHARNYGNIVGIIAVLCVWFILIWGSFVGFNKLEVKHTEFVSKDLPEAFDGYRIVVFSDTHVGSYMKHNEWVLQRAIDSINAQKPNMIAFVGDLQNIQPSEIYPHLDRLSSLRAKDGVFSILGNHDYADYLGCDDAMKVANCRETVSLERQMGWTLLLNEHRAIKRGKEQIIIAGMENDGGNKHFASKGNVKKTLNGVGKDAFVIMLEHDPYSWREHILPQCNAQLTLSGHTHNMQFALFDRSPISFLGKEVYGWYQEGDRKLFVTAGVGGLIPFRFGATGEIVVLTLRKQR